MQAFSRTTTDDAGSRQATRVPLSRRFTYRYIFAIAIFATIAFASKVVIDGSGTKIDDLSRQTTEAANQPGRVIRIGELANIVAFQNSEIKPEQVDAAAIELRDVSNTLQQVQQGLVDGDSQLGLPKTTLPPELNSLYNSPDELRATIKEISDSGRTIADLRGPGPENEAARHAAFTLITNDQPPALKGLEKALHYYTDQTGVEVAAQNSNTEILLGFSLIAAVLIVFLVFRPMARNIHLETSQLENAERMHRENNERQTFRNELSQALEVTNLESEVLATVGRAFVAVVPGNKAELLLSDESQSHLRRAQTSPSAGAAGCPVDSPNGCAAIRRGQTVVYESSQMLNVCPKLPEHEESRCSAVCVPVMFMGRALGVLHTVGRDGDPPNHTQIERLTVLASEAGNRLGIMHKTEKTERQASTDALTGLNNRRSIEDKGYALLIDRTPFSVAMADLDHFKILNDTHGHEAGDRALRLFASVLRTSLRPEDIISRYGGEEFLVLLPNTNVRDAHATLSRLQLSLAAEIAKTGSIGFTASWGLTDNTAGATFDEIVSVADTYLYGAKRSGRDAIMVDGESAERDGMELDPDAIVDDLYPKQSPPHTEPAARLPVERIPVDIDLLGADAAPSRSRD